jgi:SAM-dependent methyltransferase
MDGDKKDRMLAFWSQRAKEYQSDPRANTNDVWLREIEISYIDKIIQSNSCRRILDFGCANGYSTQRLGKSHPEACFLGVDINPDMIATAENYFRQESSPNLRFRRLDVLADTVGETFDFIFAVRVFQNIENVETQKAVFTKLCELLDRDGSLLYIESYRDGYATMNQDRVKMGLEPLPIHPHLTLLTDDFDSFASNKVKLVSRESLSSSYYLITRLLYSYIAKMNHEPIDYNHPIHQVAAMVPQIGDYGPQRAVLYRKV